MSAERDPDENPYPHALLRLFVCSLAGRKRNFQTLRQN